MKKILVSLFALVMVSVGFAGGWEFVARHDDAANKDTSFIMLDSENDPDTSVFILRCNGTNAFDMYVTTAELFIQKADAADSGSNRRYAQVTWRFDSNGATTELLSVAVSGDAVFFPTDGPITSFGQELQEGETLWIDVVGADGSPATYTFVVTGLFEAAQQLPCF